MTKLNKKIKFMEKINENSTVKVHYTGRLEDGSIFDSSLNEGREPLVATLGQGQLIRGFESGLMNMSIGEKKTIEIPHTEAYGDVNPELLMSVEKTQMPEGVQVGSFLQTMGPQGPTVVKVVEINEENVTIDANHPLAGKKLIFDLEVLEVN
jgi:FKBP-type peptidyl-prolyl cis-trans isomerase SlpA